MKESLVESLAQLGSHYCTFGENPTKGEIYPFAPEPLAMHYTPLRGQICIRLPKTNDQTKSGIYFDTSFPDGAEYTEEDYRQECMRVAAQIMNGREGEYMKKWRQIDKLKRIVRQEINRIPRKKSEKTYGADRFNPRHADVISSSTDEIKQGDRVYFGYLTIPNLRDDKRVFEDADGEYAFLPASECYLRIRGSEISMLNGWALLSPILTPTEKNGIHIHVDFEDRFNRKKAVVAYVPKGSELKKGDVVFFEKSNDVLLEYEINKLLPEEYFVMPESVIMAVETST